MKPADIELYMDFAERAALRSKANRLKVGAVLVSPDDVIAMGYNGTPKGWCNDCEDAEGKTKPEVIHAEVNGLFKFLRNGISTKGASMFITHAPCIECAKSIHLSGVENLYYKHVYRSTDGVDFLAKTDVNVVHLT